MEQKLLNLPEDSGILFAGVEVVPRSRDDVRDRTMYRIFIGCNRERDPKMMVMVVRRYLIDDIPYDGQLSIEVHRGFARAEILH